MKERIDAADPFGAFRHDLARLTDNAKADRAALAQIADFWQPPADGTDELGDAEKIDQICVGRLEQIHEASTVLDECAVMVGRVSTAIEATTDLAGRVAKTVAEEMALNAQLAEVPGAPQVAEPRLFRTPEERQIADFKIGDEVLCSPYIINKRNEVVGLSQGTVAELVTGGKKGARVLVEMPAAGGITTRYSRKISSRYLIHAPCWRAFRHSEALRKSWEKVINTSEDTMWPPLAQ